MKLFQLQIQEQEAWPDDNPNMRRHSWAVCQMIGLSAISALAGGKVVAYSSLRDAPYFGVALSRARAALLDLASGKKKIRFSKKIHLGGA
jgi:hypothetical protein